MILIGNKTDVDKSKWCISNRDILSMVAMTNCEIQGVTENAAHLQLSLKTGEGKIRLSLSCVRLSFSLTRTASNEQVLKNLYVYLCMHAGVPEALHTLLRLWCDMQIIVMQAEGNQHSNNNNNNNGSKNKNKKCCVQ